jgi:alpha-ketoglutarate-dependent taurine dioxygenase
LTYLNKAKAINPTDANIQLGLGDAYYGDKNQNESYAAYIQGVSRIMSQNLLGILFDSIKSAEATVRHEWQAGALAIWDNRVVQHKGIKDYSGARRILYRATMTA